MKKLWTTIAVGMIVMATVTGCDKTMCACPEKDPKQASSTEGY